MTSWPKANCGAWQLRNDDSRAIEEDADQPQQDTDDDVEQVPHVLAVSRRSPQRRRRRSGSSLIALGM
jgi:hypothetical protein